MKGEGKTGKAASTQGCLGFLHTKAEQQNLNSEGKSLVAESVYPSAKA